jgi:hypothetical protein
MDDDIGFFFELATLVSNIKLEVGRCKVKWFTFYVTSIECCDWKVHYYAHIFQFDLRDLGLNCQLNYKNEDIIYFS